MILTKDKNLNVIDKVELLFNAKLSYLKRSISYWNSRSIAKDWSQEKECWHCLKECMVKVRTIPVSNGGEFLKSMNSGAILYVTTESNWGTSAMQWFSFTKNALIQYT